MYMVKQEVREQVIAAAKEKHKGELFLAEYKVADRHKKVTDFCFAYRQPTAGELQAYIEMQAKDTVEAGRWLMAEVVVSTPDDTPILDIVGSNNLAASTFLAEYINPLFGKVLEKAPIQSL